MSPSSRLLSLLVVAALALTVSPAIAAPKMKAKDMKIPRGWPEVTDEQRSLTDVSYAAGVPAARLHQIRVHEWEGLEIQRSRWLYRTKILTEEGIDDHGSQRISAAGGLRLQKVEARTILPDGTIVDASDGVNTSSSDTGDTVIDVAFPQVQVGAILDLDIRYNSNGVYIQPWELQTGIPVLDTRLVIEPPIGLKFRTAVMNLPPKKASPDLSYNVAGGTKAHAWYALDVPALPDLEYLPPLPDVSQRLFVIIESYKGEFVYLPIAKDWRTWNERLQEEWDEWFSRSHGAVDRLAREAVGERPDPVDRAEAIRRVLADRFQVTVSDYHYPPEDLTPDEVLAEGSGDSSRLAGLAVLMLRAAGVDAVPAAVRRRTNGILPVEFPVESMLDDLIVRYDGERFFAPAAAIHAGSLPYDYSGIVAMPIDGETDQPVAIPDFSSAENRAQRQVDATLAADGTLTAEGTMTYTGVAAARWRGALRSRGEEERRQYVQERLRRHMPGAEVTSLDPGDLDDATGNLVVKAEWTVPGYASVAGKRLIFNPNLFARLDSSDWTQESREWPVDLGSAYDSIDLVTYSLPEGVTDIQAPDAVRFPAGEVGGFETGYGKRGDKIVAKRRMKVDVFRFPAQVYPQLRKWFVDIAAVDEQPMVVTLP